MREAHAFRQAIGIVARRDRGDRDGVNRIRDLPQHNSAVINSQESQMFAW